MRNPYVNSRTNITEKKKTSGQINEVEKFVQSNVRKINITNNIRFFQISILEQLNNQSSRSLSPYRLTRSFAQNIGILNLIQSGFVVMCFEDYRAM